MEENKINGVLESTHWRHKYGGLVRKLRKAKEDRKKFLVGFVYGAGALGLIELIIWVIP